MNMQLSEKQIEDVFEVYYKELLSPDLELVARQHILENRLRFDLLFKDKDGKNLVVELKKDAVTREDIGQSIEYAGLIKNQRVILAAPYFAESVKIAFEHYGIEYLEFNLSEIARLHKTLGENKAIPITATIEVLLENAIKTSIQSKSLKDGNIAFKVTYVDSKWLGVCSEKLYHINCFSKHKKTFCSLQANSEFSCRHSQFAHMKESYFSGDSFPYPCYDSAALTGVFSPCVSHGEVTGGKFHRALQAKVGKLALFTSKEPGDAEENRFVFMIARIDTILPPEEGAPEEFLCDVENSVILLSQRPPFWKYYSNAGNPERIAWNTGLFRYANDRVCYELLKDVIEDKTLEEDLRVNAVRLLELVS
jgi:hypothetical protein